MPEILEYEFVQRAFLAAVLVGVVASVMGVFVVLRNLSFIGAGTAHAAFAGVTLAYLLGYPPFWLALLFSLGTVWLVGYLDRKGYLRADTSVGIFFSSTMALAIFFIGLMRTYNPEVYGYLFGSLLSVTPGELRIMALLGVLVLGTLFLFFKEFHFITFDEEMAQASGIPATALSFLLFTLLALTIVLSLKSVGALLVFALLVTPAATAYQITSSMIRMFFWAPLIGTSSAVGGLFLSLFYDLPSGATIVLVVTGVFFLATFLFRK